MCSYTRVFSYSTIISKQKNLLIYFYNPLLSFYLISFSYSTVYYSHLLIFFYELFHEHLSGAQNWNLKTQQEISVAKRLKPTCLLSSVLYLYLSPFVLEDWMHVCVKCLDQEASESKS